MSLASPPTNPRVIERRAVAQATVRVLNRGGWGNADVLLVEGARGPVVVKDFSPRPRMIRRTLGRWLIRREGRAYRRLAGLPGFPRLLGQIDHDAIVLEYRPGTLLSRSLAGRVRSEFLAELEAVIDSMHARGIVHLDLRHRSNILAGEDGHPVVLDLASALHFDPERRLGRLGLALFGWIDRRALAKWRVRLAQPSRATSSDEPPVPSSRAVSASPTSEGPPPTSPGAAT